jgi:uncharacterized protein
MDKRDAPGQCAGFEWDEHNIEKNRRGHSVIPAECEQIFFNRPLVAGSDHLHSEKETHFYALGRTDAGRLLFEAFTVRGALIRVISARDANRKERRIYENIEAE